MKRICPLCNKVYDVWEKIARKTGATPTCKRCGVPLVPLHLSGDLTYDDATPRDENVRCPQCGFVQIPAKKCAACGYTFADGTMALGKAEDKESPSSLFKQPQGLEKAGRTLGLGAAVGILVLIIVSAGTFFLGILNSEPYRVAKSFIRQNEEIQRVVGRDISFGFLPTGTVNRQRNGGYAEFTIKVKGSAGSTTVFIKLRELQGKWQIVSAHYTDRNGRTRDLPASRPKRPGGESDRQP